MADIKRVVSTSFWMNGKMDDFSPEDKYFMLYLLTNPFTTQLGIYEISIKQAAFQMGYSVDAFNVLLDRFENKYHMIRFSKETNEVAIKNFLRHSIVKGGAPVRDCLVKELRKVKNRDLIAYVFSHIKGYDNLNETVKGIIAEYEAQNGDLQYSNEKQNDVDNDDENDDENENENENDESYHDSLDDSHCESVPPPPPPKPEKPIKHKYGEYNNVLLTDEELDKLKSEYPDWEDRIERLSSYIASKGTKYKSHYATIRNWARKDAEAKQANTQRPAQQPRPYSNPALDYVRELERRAQHDGN